MDEKKKTRPRKARRRANGDGSLILRGGYWYAVWYVNGKRMCRTTKCAVKRDAEKKLAEFVRPTQAKSDIEKLETIKARIEDIRAGNLEVGKTMPTRIAFMVDVYKEDVSRDSDLSERTAEIYQSTVDKLDEFAKGLGKSYVHEITDSDAVRYFSEMAKNVKPVTYNLNLRVLKAMVKVVMKRDNNIKKNPFVEITPKKVDKSHHRRELTEEEVAKILEAAEKVSAETKIWFMLGAYCGLRRGDAAKLRWKDVDLRARMIRVLPAKTQRSGLVAKIPIVTVLYKELEALDKSSEYVIPEVASLSVSRVGEIVREVFTAAGVNIVGTDSKGERYFETGFHSFRHSLASRLAREGVPVNQIQMILAHSKADMSLYYSHAAEADLHIPEHDGTKAVRLRTDIIEELKRRSGKDDPNEALAAILGLDAQKQEVQFDISEL